MSFTQYTEIVTELGLEALWAASPTDGHWSSLPVTLCSKAAVLLELCTKLSWMEGSLALTTGLSSSLSHNTYNNSATCFIFTCLLPFASRNVKFHKGQKYVASNSVWPKTGIVEQCDRVSC